MLLAAFYTVTKGTKLSENRTVIKKLSFEIPQAGSLIFAYCDANFALPKAFFFGWYKISIAPEAYRKPRKLCLFLL